MPTTINDYIQKKIVMRKVYFEIGGHKMVMSVDSKTDKEAIEKVKNKIIFHKVTEEKEKSIEQLFKEILDIVK